MIQYLQRTCPGSVSCGCQAFSQQPAAAKTWQPSLAGQLSGECLASAAGPAWYHILCYNIIAPFDALENIMIYESDLCSEGANLVISVE